MMRSMMSRLALLRILIPWFLPELLMIMTHNREKMPGDSIARMMIFQFLRLGVTEGYEPGSQLESAVGGVFRDAPR